MCNVHVAAACNKGGLYTDSDQITDSKTKAFTIQGFVAKGHLFINLMGLLVFRIYV